MKILITGGLGHIGSRLHTEFDNVTIVDNLSTQRYCSLFSMPKTHKFIQSDFTLTKNLISEQDVIIHLAAITDAASSFDNEEKVKEVNEIQTIDFLDEAIKQNKHIIFPSSTSVYGENLDIMYENSDNINPQSPYAESKLVVEKFLKDYKYATILRLGTIYGPSVGMRFHTAINKFCYQARFDQELTVWKQNISMERPYLGLYDAYDVFKLVINNKLFGLYNVITDNYKLSSVLDLIKTFVPDVKIKETDCPLINQYSYRVNMDKILKEGYIPKYKLEKGISDTLKVLGL